MSDPFARHKLPQVPLIGAGLLVAVTLVSVTLFRMTGAPVPDEAAAAVVYRDLHFDDRPDGGIEVTDAARGRAIARLAPGADGFVRSTMRGFARERRQRGIGPEVPFRLSARSDGRLTLDDPATGRRVDLEAFGATNAGAFARLLSSGDEPR